jgi:hypothetical protein
VNGANADIYMTSGTGANNSLVKFTDAAAFNATITSGTPLVLATAGANKVFRGLAFTPEGLTIGPASLPNGTQGTPYSQTVTATGGAGSPTFAVTVGSLPTGLTLNSTSGVISGTPAGTGTSNFTITATSATGITASKAYSITVTVANTVTTTSLTSISPLTATAGTSITFSGTVVAGSGSTTPTGTVEIRNGGAGGTLLASTTTIGGSGVNGTFSISATTIPVGSYSNIQAFYIPTGSFTASNSTVFASTLTINPAPTSTTTSLTSIAPLTATAGTSITFGGTVVAGSGTSTPTGTVQIRNGGAGGTLLASTATIGGSGASGTFTINSTTIPVGTYSNIQAFYVPSGSFSASNSAAFGSTLTITAPNTATTTAVTTSSGNVVYGTPVTFTATVTAASGTAAPTAGSVEFFDNGVSLGTTATVASSGSGFATFTYTISPNQMQVNGGAAHTVTATYTAGAGFTGSSSSGGGNASQTITAKGLTVSGVTAASRSYDGTTTATLSTGGAALVGVVVGDTITLNTGGATGTFATRHVGTGIAVTVAGLTISGTAAANYTLAQPTTAADITARAITVTAGTNSRVYDATTAAAAVPTVTSGSLAAGDTGSFSEVYNTKDVGTGKTLIPSGVVLDGNGGNDYAVTFVNNTTGAITAAGLTVGGITAISKVYDSTTAATLNVVGAALVGVFAGDTVTLNTGGATGTFASKDVATGITVTVSGLTISGSSAGNYTLTQPTTSADITAAPLTVSGVTASNKVYDRTTAASLNFGSATLVGVFAGDTVTLTTGGASGTFATPNVGPGIVVTVSGLAISGASVGNYTLVQPTTSANITAAALTVSGITANDKVYNRTTAATLNVGGAALVGVFIGDTVTLNTGGATGTFASADVGPGITVAVSGLTISGGSVGNYTLTQPTTSATITAAGLTVSGITAADKVYDSTTSATLSLGSAALVGVFAGDAVTLNTGGAGGTFATANVGPGIVVAVAGLTISGASAGNYTLTQPTASASITAAPLTVTGVIASNKVYDRTTAASLNLGSAALVGVFAGDTVTPNTGGASGTFATPNVGPGIVVTVTGLTITGSSAGNYTLVQPTTSANITAAPLTVSGVTANDKVYDATAAAALDTTSAALVGVFVGDTVTLNGGSAVGTFATRHVGTATPVAVFGLTLGGPQAGNYTLTQPTTAANITARPLTVTAVANTKPFDGNTSATAIPAITSGSLQGSDTAVFVETYDTPAAGTGKTLTPSGVVIDGNGGADYSYTFVSVNTGVITPSVGTTTAVSTSQATVTYGTAVTFTATVTAAAGTPTGAVEFFDDTMGIDLGIGTLLGTIGTSATWTFTTAPTQLKVNVSPAAHAIRAAYTATAQFLGSSGTLGGGERITPAPLTVGGITAVNKVYDRTTAATLDVGGAALVGVFAGDSVTLNVAGATGNFATRNVGNGLGVAVSGLTPGGPQAGNYTLTQPTTAANITPRPLTVTAVPNTKTFDGTTGAAAVPSITSGTLAPGDAAAFIETYDTPTPGTGKTLTPSGSVLDGNGGSNYAVTFVAVQTGTITPASAQTLRFDFNSPASPGATAAGFTASFPGDTLAADGAGWTTPVHAFDTGSGGATTVPQLFRDFAWGTGRETFQVAVTAGATYSLRLYVGDARAIGGYVIQARAYDSQTGPPAFATVTTTQGGFNTLVFGGVAAASGVVNVDVQVGPDGNGAWVLNGLDVWNQSSAANDPGAALASPPPPPVAATRRLDFNAPNNPAATAAGFTAAFPTDTLSGNGAGWATAVNFYDTGGGGNSALPLLFGDFAWGTGLRTFQIAASPGTTYGLRLYVGDSRMANGGYAIQARAYDSRTGSPPAFSTVSTLSGGFNVLTLTGVTAGSGVINVEVQAAPGGNGIWVLDGLDVWDQSSAANEPASALVVPPPPAVPAARRFDFNAAGNPGATATGFTAVLPGDTVGATGRGWVTPVNAYDTGSGGATTTPLLYRDFVWGTGRQTFQVNATPGIVYSVRLYIGDSRALGGYAVQVRAFDSQSGSPPAFTTATTTSGGFSAVVLGGVVAPSGVISVEVQAAPGGNGVWVVDGIDVWDQGNSANDPGQAPQLAASVRAASGGATLTDADLAPLVRAVVSRWAATGLDSTQLATLKSVTYRIADLDDQGALGLTGLGSAVVTLDDDGAGHGWFIDPTPDLDDEFVRIGPTELVAGFGSAAVGRYDLLTVIEHELGHVLGLDDLASAAAPTDLMTEYLTPGLRRVLVASSGVPDVLPAAPPELVRITPGIDPVPGSGDLVTVPVSVAPCLPTSTADAVVFTSPIAWWLAPMDEAAEDDPLRLSGVRVD